MINRIIQFSIRNKFAIGLLTIALILFGSYSLTQLPIDAVPDITNNQVQVITVTPTLATQEVEQFVTAPLERSMASLPDLEEIRSISRFGLSVVTIVFKDNVEIYFARQLVDQRIREAKEQIPKGLGEPEMAPVSTGLGEIYQYILRPQKGYENTYTAADLRTMQDWIVARQLIGTPGVAEVSSFGGILKQYEVTIDPVRLKSMNVTMDQIFEALETNNENTGGAYIEKKPNAYFIRGLGLITSLDDIGKIVVTTNSNGTPVLIRDVAAVQLGSAIRYGSLTRNGEGEVAGGIVLMLKGSNSAEVVNAVKKKIPTIQRSLPEGVTIEPFLDRTSLVNRSIRTVKTNLIEGALIVIFILVLFLGNLRASLIVASVIPLSMLFAVIMMNLFGVTGNLMSLGAIDFGLIVDGAVIIVEAVLFKVLHSKFYEKEITTYSQEQMDHEVRQTASQMMNSATFGQIIILIVYIPIFSLIGIEGKMFRPMAMTVSFAIIGAILLSLTYIPVMSTLFLPKKISHKRNLSDRMMGAFHRWYEPVINFAMHRKLIVIATGLLLFIGSTILFSRMGGEFIPTLEEGDFAFHNILPGDASLSMSIENNARAEKILLQFPEVREVVSKTGSAEIPTDPMPPNFSDVIIVLKEKDEWKTAETREELQDTMIKALQQIPGVFFEASQPIQMRFNELMSGVRQDVAIKIFGENIDTLLQYANEAAAVISTVEGSTEPQVEPISGLPQISIDYDRNRIAQYGLNIRQINRVVRTAFAGEAAGVVFENERRFDLVVRLQESNRKDIEDVRNLFIPLPSGGQVPLQQLATIEFKSGPAQISREDAKRRVVVGINVRGRDVQSVVNEIQDKLDKQIKLPAGYYFTYGGQFENLREASKRLLVAVPVALLLIFVLLFFTFSSFREALLIYTAIPMSAIGGVVALWLRDMPFSISAGVGFIALFGVAVLNGIVLISTFNQLEKEGITDIFERVRRGTQIRFRPVLMTASVASFGFLPMALSTSAGAEVQRPLATVVIGGLVTATALTLIVLPALYIIFSRKKKISMPLAVTAIVLVLLSQNLNAQTPASRVLSLDSCIAIALRNNPSIQSSRLKVTQHQKLEKTAFDPGRTELFYENEDLIKGNDTEEGILKIGLSQTIEFPATWFAQNKFNKQSTIIAETSLSLAQKELIQKVTGAYYKLWLAREKQKMWQTQDTIFSDFNNAASLRFTTGETGKLEMISAQAKHREIQLTLQQARMDLTVSQQELMQLMNVTLEILPPDEPLQKNQVSIPSDASPVLRHPFLTVSQQKISLAEFQKRVEVSKLFPDLSARYFNQSWYGLEQGYYGYSLGIGIPLFFWTQQGKIQYAKLQQQIAQKDFEADRLQFDTQYKKALQEYQNNLSLLNYYEAHGLQQADEIYNAAQEAYKAGEIGYFEYTTLLIQSFEIKVNYLDALNELNQSAILINFYSGQ